MASGPWPARVMPWACYLVLLMIVGFARDIDARLYPSAYTLMCGFTVWLLYRYRKHLPELNWRFHWGAIPVAIFVTIAWIGLGWAMAGEFTQRFDALLAGQPIAAIDPEQAKLDFRNPPADDTYGMGYSVGWTALILRLVGMSLVVPMFEELFIRSLLLRSFHNVRLTMAGLIQMASDFPVTGDYITKTKMSERADAQGAVFTKQFNTTPLGALSMCGLAVSTLVFMFSHIPRDWPACIACAAAYCALLWWTNQKRIVHPDNTKNKKPLGLGPVIWAHGLTNALLWVYTVTTNDWQFL